MDPTRTYSYRIEPRDVDFMLRTTLASLTDYILKAAGEDADANGFGIRNLSAEDSTWVLLRIAVEVERMPQEYEKINIETWVSEVGRLTTVRNFIIRNADGERIGAAVTHWAMINLTTRRPVDLRTHPGYIDFKTGISCPIDEPSRIQSCVPSHRDFHAVRYSDVDFNRHASSVKYIEWIINMLPSECHTDCELQRFEINFLKESRLGDHLELLIEHGESPCFEIKNDLGAPICRAIIHWKHT